MFLLKNKLFWNMHLKWGKYLSQQSKTNSLGDEYFLLFFCYNAQIYTNHMNSLYICGITLFKAEKIKE